MMLFGVTSVPVMMLNMLNQYIPLILLSGADYLTVCARAGVGYLINVFTVFLFPRFEVVSYLGLAVSVIAELSLIYGLLRGNEQK
jgi:hypothetical protein